MTFNGIDTMGGIYGPLENGCPQHDYDKLAAVCERMNQETVLAQFPSTNGDAMTSCHSKWAFDNWVEQGDLTLLVGAPSCGKTLFLTFLAAKVSVGIVPDSSPYFKPLGGGYIIWITSEDNPAKVLIPRLLAAGAAISKIIFVSLSEGRDGKRFNIFDAEGQKWLRAKNMQLGGNIGLIILDPIYAGADFDHNNSYRSGLGYESLISLAQELDCAIIGVAHAVKNQRGKEPLQRVGGSSSLTRVPRAIPLITKILNGPTTSGATHVLLHAKNNNGTMDGGFEYRIVLRDIDGVRVPCIDIVGSLSGTPEEILAYAESKSPASARVSKLEEATNFLESFLSGGPKLRNEVYEAAKGARFSSATLESAKTGLNVKTHKRKGDGLSVWGLPEQP